MARLDYIPAVLRRPSAIGVVALAALGATALAFSGPAAAAETPPQPTLRLGSVGPAVTLWQGIVGVATDGSFGPQTDSRTRDWQSGRGLTPDGVVGPKTWEAAGLRGSGVPAPQGGGGAPKPPGQPPDPGEPPSQPPEPPAPPTQPTDQDAWGFSNDVEARDAQILSMVDAGLLVHEWARITWSVGGRTASVLVSRRAAALRPPWGGEDLTITLSFNACQALADRLGGCMPTTRVLDECWRQATRKIAPITLPVAGMSSAAAMIKHSDLVRAAVGEYTSPAPLPNEGKAWVLTRRFSTPAQGGTGIEKPQGEKGSRHNSANFGWYLASGGSKSPGGLSVIQSIGLAHNRRHCDYSQKVYLLKLGSLTIDGQPADLAAALADPSTSALIQDEGGVLPGIRHPDL